MVNAQRDGIDVFLKQARLAIANAQETPAIAAALAEFGYGAERMQQGQALYDAALTAQQQQQIEYGDQYGATAALQEARDRAQASYMRLVKISRIVTRNDPARQQKLGLNGARRQSLSGWLQQAQQFYVCALGDADFLAGLAEYGMSQEKVTAGRTELDAVVAAQDLQARERGEAQAATQTRDLAFDALREWLSDFITIARIALEEQPQLLESLGIVEPS